MQEIIISEENEGQRLNKFLGRYLDAAPQSFIYKMLRKKNIKWNQKKANGDEILKTGDRIQIYMTDETIMKFRLKETEKKPDIQSNLDVLYEDSDVLILNKPTNLLSQKASPTDYTLNEMIVDYYRNKPGKDALFVPSVCNRLDRNTSGIILAGMSLKGSRLLSAMLKERTLDKYYITVVSGHVAKKERINGYLIKSESHNRVAIYDSLEQVSAEGKASYIETLYEPLQYGCYKDKNFTLLKVKLITGKTHQIRAHLYSRGYPIIGDGKYGDKHINNLLKKDLKLKHQLLHAYCVSFPDAGKMNKAIDGQTITAKPPKLFCEIVEALFGECKL